VLLPFPSIGPAWWGGDGERCDAREGRHAERDCRGAATNGDVGLGELLRGSGEADAEPFGFAEPAFVFCFGDAGGEVVTDLDQALLLAWVDAKQGAADAAVFVDAAGAIGASAVAQSEPAAFEVAEELVPFRARPGRCLPCVRRAEHGRAARGLTAGPLSSGCLAGRSVASRCGQLPGAVPAGLHQRLLEVLTGRR
jgi:hypothetical protein